MHFIKSQGTFWSSNLHVVQQKAKIDVFAALLQNSQRTKWDRHFFPFENMSRRFPDSVYLARQVRDALCHGLARLCMAQLCLHLIVLPTHSLIQIRSDSMFAAHRTHSLRTCEML